MASLESPFLALPQEIRDLIYGFAFDETLAAPTEYKTFVDGKEVRQSTALSQPGVASGVHRFQTRHPSTPPQPTWYSVSLCCRQTYRDVHEFFDSQAKGDEEAVLDIELTSTSAKTTWLRLPTPNPKSLRIELRITHIFDAALCTHPPGPLDNRALRTTFETLRRYITHGPHLSRPSSLSSSLQKLDTLTVNVSPAWSAEEMAFYFGHPGEQFRIVVDRLRGWIEAVVRCGVLDGWVGEVRLGSEVEGCEGGSWEVPGAEIWDEGVVVGMRGLGYVWE